MSYETCMRYDREPFTRAEAEALPTKVLLKVGRAEFRVADLMALIRDYYDAHPTGGALHCCLDDGNMDGVEYELDHALNGWSFTRCDQAHHVPPDPAAALIAELLLLMSERDRFMLYRRGYGAALHESDAWKFEETA